MSVDSKPLRYWEFDEYEFRKPRWMVHTSVDDYGLAMGGVPRDVRVLNEMAERLYQDPDPIVFEGKEYRLDSDESRWAGRELCIKASGNVLAGVNLFGSPVGNPNYTLVRMVVSGNMPLAA